MNKVNQLLILLGILLVMVGCAPTLHTIPDFSSNPPHSIAILPVLNETVDLDPSAVFQRLIFNKMRYKGYKLQDPQEVKKLLAQKKIKEAGQVFSLSYVELGKLLGADTLLFCTVTDWSTVYLGVYSSVTVEAKFELIQASNGIRLWEAEKKSSRRQLALNAQSALDTLTNALATPYEPLAQLVVEETLDTLPQGPYYQVLPRNKVGLSVWFY